MLFNNMLPMNAISYLILILLTFCLVNPFPSTPLNQRNQDISWQAWLLVDDQNNNRINSDAIPRKRITAKSVFIAPTFSPEDLPPCAEGYSSDPLGRCIKIIKLDEDKHLEFLVNKISNQFGNVDYEEDIEIEEMEVPTGPIQFSIPFSDGDGDYSNDSPQEESNFAIMFTPVENDRNKDDEIIKIDKRQEEPNDEDDDLKDIQKTEEDIEDNDSEDQRYESTTIVETTTNVYEPPTTLITQEDEVPSVSKLEITEPVTNVEDTTLNTESDNLAISTETVTDDFTKVDEITTSKLDESTTNEKVQTTTNDEFVIDPTNKPESIKIIIDNSEYFTTDSVTDNVDTTAEVPATTVSAITTTERSTTPKVTTYHPRSTKVTTYHPHLENKNNGYVQFPESSHHETTAEPTMDFVRFPDTGNQQESLNHRTRDVSGQFGNFVNEFVPTDSKGELSRSEKNQFRFPGHSGKHRMITNGQQYEYPMDTSTPKPFNRRNREKHNNFFGLTSDIMGRQPHRPLVLRFSKKHPQTLDVSKFKSHEFYRSLPQEDLSYLFGYRRTNRQTKPSQTDSHRNR